MTLWGQKGRKVLDKEIQSRLKTYQLTALFSILFALVGFSYNVWRMEASEYNSTTRIACFELFIQLSELEQLVFAAHYDKDAIKGNPRLGWVKVGLINDLGSVTDKKVGEKAKLLHDTWSKHWQTMPEDRRSVDLITTDIDSIRNSLRELLKALN